MSTLPPHQSLPLSLQQVFYSTRGTTLIHDMNLRITSATTSIILGHNGSGKSLLLKLLHGVIRPTHGQILWHQTAPHISQYWRTFLLQRPTFFDRSIAYNIEFVLRVAGVDKREHKTHCEHALETCGLTHISQRTMASLSGGELQKASLARAWVLHPSVILLDEPTVALDPPSVISFEKIIKQFEASGTKIIMTTHDLTQAKRLASEIIFIDKGRMIEQSEAKHFFSAPTSHQAQRFISGELL